jgi:hypothetical protein
MKRRKIISADKFINLKPKVKKLKPYTYYVQDLELSKRGWESLGYAREYADRGWKWKNLDGKIIIIADTGNGWGRILGEELNK